MKRISLILISVFVLFLFSCQPPNNKKNKNTNNVNNDTIEFPNDDDLYEPDTTKIIETDTTLNVEVNDTTENVMVEDEEGNIKPKDKDTVIENANYYIIVGSYKNLKFAKNEDASLKAKGYQAQILPKVGKLNRVAIASFEKEKDARAKMTKLKKDLKNNTIWLLYK